MDNKSYGMDQHSGACPCKHGTNGNAQVTSREEAEAEDIDAILKEYGFEDTTEVEPISKKQETAITLISRSLKMPVPDLTGWSTDMADEYLAELKAKHAGVAK